MKKTLKLNVIFLFTFFAFIIWTKAASYEGTYLYDAVAVRSGPGTNYTKLTSFNTGKVLSMPNNTIYKNEGGCAAGWYQVYYSGTNIGYSCSSYIKVVEVKSDTTNGEDAVVDEDFETYIKNNFPESYWTKLIDLHKKHPKWTFEPINTGLNWSSVISAQTKGNISLISTKYDGYKSTADGNYNWLTNTWTIYDGSSWVAAHADVVAYYIDPRNWLNETQIWQFEKLSFDATYQTKNAIAEVFTASSYLRNYVDTFYEAGQIYNINPIYLGSRVRQETGNSGGTATSGATFTYEGKTYSGIYNMYNIGATSGTGAVYRGLVWAAGGSDGSGTTHLRPWTSRETSIKGGASFLATNYIARGQYTSYLQKFNVAPPAGTSPHTHQYMQNVQAVASESTSSYASYLDMDLLDTAFKFAIPVFNNMPSSTKLPNTANPNNRLKSIKINGTAITGFAHDKNEYTVYVSDQATKAEISADIIVSGTTTSGTGSINLTTSTTKANIKVTAANGDINTYIVNIVKVSDIEQTVTDIVNNIAVKTNNTNMSGINFNTSLTTLINMISKQAPTAKVEIKTSSGVVKSAGNLVTGDTVKITNGADSKTYTIVIYGDVSGAGKTSVLDLLKVQKHILNSSKLTGAALQAADANRDGVVNVADLLRIQKTILGEAKIDQ